MSDRLVKKKQLYAYLDFEGPINEVIARLQQEKEQYKDEVNVRIDYTTHYDDQDTFYKYFLVADRPETDQEYEKRQQDEAKNEAWERRQYEALKKKYGNAG